MHPHTWYYHAQANPLGKRTASSSAFGVLLMVSAEEPLLVAPLCSRNSTIQFASRLDVITARVSTFQV